MQQIIRDDEAGAADQPENENCITNFFYKLILKPIPTSH